MDVRDWLLKLKFATDSHGFQLKLKYNLWNLWREKYLVHFADSRVIFYCSMFF